MSLVFFFSVLIGFSFFILLLVRRPFDPPFLYAMHSLLLMLPPALIHLTDFRLSDDILEFTNFDRANLMLSFAFLLSIFGVIFGYLVFRIRPIGKSIFPRLDETLSLKVGFIGLVFLTIAGFFVFLAPLKSANFDVANAVSAVRHHGFFSQGLSGLRLFLFFGSMLSGGFWVLLLKNKKEDKPTYGLTAIVGVLFLINLLMSLILGGKSFIIFPLVYTALAYEICVYKGGYHRIIAGLALVACLVVVLQYLRTDVVSGYKVSSAETIYQGLYFSGYDISLLYVDVADQMIETTPGQDFVNGFSLIVPRALWPDKPTERLTAGSRLIQELYPDNSRTGGWPPYGFAQWYVNFSWPGVVFGGILTGWILALLRTAYSDYRENPFSLIFMLNTILFILGPWPGGVHNLTLITYCIYILPIFLFRWLSSKALYQSRAIAS